MAQLVKVLAVSLTTLIQSLECHMEEGKNQVPHVLRLLHLPHIKLHPQKISKHVIKMIMCMCVRAWVHVHHSAHMESRRQLWGAGSLLLPRGLVMELCHQACTARAFVYWVITYLAIENLMVCKIYVFTLYVCFVCMYVDCIPHVCVVSKEVRRERYTP